MDANRKRMSLSQLMAVWWLLPPVRVHQALFIADYPIPIERDEGMMSTDRLI